ncbi:hypothetical protein [Aliidiomarina haloalkalitolerans]|uniref:Fis family transcriptional regulator n=1 Tax=Aliidiomarina haloalkalitolerans TaxID=859059 RepID=A0A432VUS4_9GAMM|nr:hypothetical protein [Aliidiomarina haloalkalitolerans]RUO20128.1 hypothetical protein CWE06_05720 [Aliidiomarina haloalkalitolerans]
MRKSDKKLENEIIRRLTDVCETMKPQLTGFVWLTHEVNYQRFPASLVVTLVFNDEVTEQTLLEEFAVLLPKVQAALQPVLGRDLPAKQIEARREHRLN